MKFGSHVSGLVLTDLQVTVFGLSLSLGACLACNQGYMQTGTNIGFHGSVCSFRVTGPGLVRASLLPNCAGVRKIFASKIGA